MISFTSTPLDENVEGKTIGDTYSEIRKFVNTAFKKYFLPNNIKIKKNKLFTWGHNYGFQF